jgi:hypothetical protein
MYICRSTSLYQHHKKKLKLNRIQPNSNNNNQHILHDGLLFKNYGWFSDEQSQHINFQNGRLKNFHNRFSSNKSQSGHQKRHGEIIVQHKLKLSTYFDVIK